MQLLIARKGAVEILEAPDPVPAENEILIETAFSAISPGTELEALSQQSPSVSVLIERGIRSWDKIKTSLQRRGWKQTLIKVAQAIEKPLTLGYSISGRVTRVGSAVHEFGAGDWVAAAGPWAGHGTMACVPRLFCVKLPRHEMARDASMAALACIAIHAAHRAELSAGAEVGVFGLGAIGQFMVQVLRASGHRVVAFDPIEYRRTDAKVSGVETHDPDQFDFERGSPVSSHGKGLDAVFLCAKTDSPNLIRHAAALCRKRGRLIVVGEFPIQMSREIVYEKELEVRFSAAYGEGRYDPTYELLGKDYPIDTGRWTVERNLQLFVRWLEEGRIAPSRLRPRVESFQQATEVYDRLARGALPLDDSRDAISVLTLFEYPSVRVKKSVLELQPRSAAFSTATSITVVGTGRFAVETHLPNLRQAPDKFQIHSLVSRTPVKVAGMAKKFGVSHASCDLNEMLKDSALAAVLIATPHASHASQVIACLEAGKHVFVEKPLCLNEEELDRIQKARRPAGNNTSPPVLFVGFNRRYAPLSRKLFEERVRKKKPLDIRYEFFLSPLPNGEWYDRPEQGGRFIGEVCHAVDWIFWMIGCPLRRQTATRGPSGDADIFLEFEDASRAHLRCQPVYQLDGPKETIEVKWENIRWRIEDFAHLEIFEDDSLAHKDRFHSKGHREALDAFAAAIFRPENGSDPYGFFESTQLTLELDRAIRSP